MELVNIFLQRKVFQGKKTNQLFKANQPDTRPEKGQKVYWNLIGQTSWNKARFLKFGLKRTT